MSLNMSLNFSDQKQEQEPVLSPITLENNYKSRPQSLKDSVQIQYNLDQM